MSGTTFFEKAFPVDSYAHCSLCPRRCGVNRHTGQKGFCGASDKPKVARAALHFWEEPAISGTAGSGTVFFSHCTLRCVYCQNSEISIGGHGVEITVERLAEIFHELEGRGAHNINLVTPTHYVPSVIEAVGEARRTGLGIPIIYNTSGYESVETIGLLDGIIDVYLTDFKYWQNDYGKRCSSVADYRMRAIEALEEMVSQVGAPKYRIVDADAIDEADGSPGIAKLMVSGVIVRHLVLPGMVEDAKQILETIFSRFGNDVVMSLMSQYTPRPSSLRYPELQRRVAREEYEELLDFADMLYPDGYFWQDGDAAKESFIPPFDDTGVSS